MSSIYYVYTMVKGKIILEDFEECLEREVKEFGNATHITLPLKHKDKKAYIVIRKSK